MFRIRRRMPPSEWDQDPKIDPSPQELGFPPTEPQNVGPVFRAPDRAWNPGFVAGLFLILGTAYLAVAALLTTATIYPGQRNTGPVPPSSLGAEHLVVWNADSVLAFSAWTVPGVGDPTAFPTANGWAWAGTNAKTSEPRWISFSARAFCPAALAFMARVRGCHRSVGGGSHP